MEDVTVQVCTWYNVSVEAGVFVWVLVRLSVSVNVYVSICMCVNASMYLWCGVSGAHKVRLQH